MTKSEQQRMIRDLQGFERKMSRPEFDTFAMLRKRDKDDEDFDALAVRTLEEMHAKFLPARSKPEIDDLWKKISSKSPQAEE